MDATSTLQDRETELSAIVYRYYSLIDLNDLEQLFLLFASTIHYVRGSKEIDGMPAFQTFYRIERQIISSRHCIDKLTQISSTVTVEGHAEVQLKDGTADTVIFTDIFTFQDGKIIRRITEFPDREV